MKKTRKNFKDLTAFALGCCLVVSVLPVTAYAGECVVLLHGLLRSSSSMSRLEETLSDAGFDVVNINYPSRSSSVDGLADEAVSRGIQECSKLGGDVIHFVTHSLGGILVRQYFSEHTDEKPGRVVMLGPPNHGSEVVDFLQEIPGFELLNGPAVVELGTESQGALKELGPVDFELGVIAGTVSINPLFNLVVPDPNDGTVSVDSTRVEGMSAHIILPVSHSLMMYDRDVIDNVVHFLRTGQFMPSED